MALTRFEEEIIHNALSNAFPPSLEASHPLIAQEILRLTQLLKPQYIDDFPELSIVTDRAENILGPLQSVEAGDLHKLYNSLKKQRQLEELYFVAFLSCTMDSPSQDSDQFDQYKALTFFVSVKLYILGAHESAIKAVCNEVRQWALGQRDSLSNQLPEVIRNQFANLIDDLFELRLESSNKCNTLTSKDLKGC
ncbi:hypothetical protein [Shewanella sp.]|uniref:hypothetical protein n=1 Tax=Shewanella sp. TaxID=50422 RepID=UPI001EC40BB5|nr:hypothetical protein [Shewanella sp.]NRB24388.1 hypothetical protein [Shewanella sp.]